MFNKIRWNPPRAQEGELRTARKRREIRSTISTVDYANNIGIAKKAILPNNPNKFRHSPS